jgi:hypothetical protein
MKDDKRKQAILFIKDMIKLIEKYKDLDMGDLKEVIKFLSRSTSSPKPPHKSPQGSLPELSPETIQSLYSMSREDLVKFLNNKELLPNIGSLRKLAKALHIKDVSHLSEEQIKQKIILVVYDKPNELNKMLEMSKRTSSEDNQKKE